MSESEGHKGKRINCLYSSKIVKGENSERPMKLQVSIKAEMRIFLSMQLGKHGNR